MDEVIRDLINQLPPDAQDLLERLLAGEWPPEDMFAILIAIWEMCGRNSQLLMRLVAQLVRSGQLPARLMERLWTMLNLPGQAAAAGGAEGVALGGAAAEGGVAGGAAVEGTAAGAGAAGSGGTGGAVAGGAGGIGAAGVASILFAVAAVALAAYLISREANREIVQLPGGSPCGGTDPDAVATATNIRSVTVNAFGGRNSYNQAIEQAQAICAQSAGACKGSCGGGKKCQPNVSVQTVDQTFMFFYTKTELTFTCPCECL